MEKCKIYLQQPSILFLSIIAGFYHRIYITGRRVAIEVGSVILSLRPYASHKKPISNTFYRTHHQSYVEQFFQLRKIEKQKKTMDLSDQKVLF